VPFLGTNLVNKHSNPQQVFKSTPIDNTKNVL